MRLRQVALAAEALEPSRSQLFELLGLDADFLDAGVAEFGLTNSVMAIGNEFLEIVAPIEAHTAAGRTLARRGVEACGYMALLQVDDYAAFDARIGTLALRKVWETDRPEVSACHIHPKDIGGAIVSFDEMRPPEDWVWGGPNWQARRARNISGIAGVTLRSSAPEGLAGAWARVMDLPALPVAGAGHRITCDDGTFVDFIAGDDYEGIESVTFRCDDAAARYAHAEAIGLGAPGQPRIGDFGIHFTDKL